MTKPIFGRVNLIALEWSDIDWRSKKVVFRRSSTLGVIGPTKSGKERKVPLTATLFKALRNGGVACRLLRYLP